MMATLLQTEQRPHSEPTPAEPGVWPLCGFQAVPVVPPACGDPLRGSASAVPDHSPTPRGP